MSPRALGQMIAAVVWSIPLASKSLAGRAISFHHNIYSGYTGGSVCHVRGLVVSAAANTSL